MTGARSEDVTTLLGRLHEGDESALEQLMETVYAESTNRDNVTTSHRAGVECADG